MLSERFHALDGFRGLASLSILCFHILPGSFGRHQAVLGFLDRLRIGTDIFFVISGFGVAIAVHKILTQDRSIKAFLLKRAKRIYLIYFFSLLFAAVVIPTLKSLLSFLNSGHYYSYYFDYSLLDWLKILSLVKVFDSSNWALNQAFLPLNGVFWFIAVIMQIYLVTALALTSRNHCNKILVGITLLSLLCLIPQVKDLVPSGLFLPKWREFAMGMLLFHALRRFPAPPAALQFAVGAAILLLAGAILTLTLPSDLYRFLSAVVVGATFWLLYPLDKPLSGSRPFRLLKWLGMFSYSTYLLHIPLWPLLDMLTRRLAPLPEPVVATLVMVPAILVCSYLWHLFFERPDSLAGVSRSLRHPLLTLKGIA